MMTRVIIFLSLLLVSVVAPYPPESYLRGFGNTTTGWSLLDPGPLHDQLVITDLAIDPADSTIILVGSARVVAENPENQPLIAKVGKNGKSVEYMSTPMTPASAGSYHHVEVVGGLALCAGEYGGQAIVSKLELKNGTAVQPSFVAAQLGSRIDSFAVVGDWLYAYGSAAVAKRKRQALRRWHIWKLSVESLQPLELISWDASADPITAGDIAVTGNTAYASGSDGKGAKAFVVDLVTLQVTSTLSACGNSTGLEARGLTLLQPSDPHVVCSDFSVHQVLDTTGSSTVGRPDTPFPNATMSGSGVARIGPSGVAAVGHVSGDSAVQHAMLFAWDASSGKQIFAPVVVNTGELGVRVSAVTMSYAERTGQILMAGETLAGDALFVAALQGYDCAVGYLAGARCYHGVSRIESSVALLDAVVNDLQVAAHASVTFQGKPAQLSGLLTLTLDNSAPSSSPLPDVYSDTSIVAPLTFEASPASAFDRVQLSVPGAPKCRSIHVDREYYIGPTLSVHYQVTDTCGLSTGAVAGLVVGLVVVAGLAVGIPLSIIRYRNQQDIAKKLAYVEQNM